ncbi:MAG: dethiobiotin synthase [Lysobacterales bacterium]
MNLFVVGTDTGVGKTVISAGLIRALRALGRDAVALKPVASGFDIRPDGRHNEDIEALLAAADGALTASEINVYGFDPAIAPHRAAELAGVEIELEPICRSYQAAAGKHQDVLVEGVGGFAVPLSPRWMLADLVRALDLPVLLVVGVRLGCINHALLSAQAITATGLHLQGWIANHLSVNMEQAEASVQAIAERLSAPLLGQISCHPPEREFASLAAALLRAADGRKVRTGREP